MSDWFDKITNDDVEREILSAVDEESKDELDKFVNTCSSGNWHCWLVENQYPWMFVCTIDIGQIYSWPAFGSYGGDDIELFVKIIKKRFEHVLKFLEHSPIRIEFATSQKYEMGLSTVKKLSSITARSDSVVTKPYNYVCPLYFSFGIKEYPTTIEDSIRTLGLIYSVFGQLYDFWNNERHLQFRYENVMYVLRHPSGEPDSYEYFEVKDLMSGEYHSVLLPGPYNILKWKIADNLSGTRDTLLNSSYVPEKYILKNKSSLPDAINVYKMYLDDFDQTLWTISDRHTKLKQL